RLNQYRGHGPLQGEYRFTGGRLPLGQLAVVTNVHKSNAGGSAVWFTDRTLFDGPVHTNEYFRFYRNPWFGHKVTTAGCPENQRGTQVNPSTDRKSAVQGTRSGLRVAGGVDRHR